MNKQFSDVVGWYGTGAIVLAYALVSFSVIRPEGLVYQLLNATGALGIVVVSFQKKAYQSGVLNVIWTIIALLSIVRIMFG